MRTSNIINIDTESRIYPSTPEFGKHLGLNNQKGFDLQLEIAWEMNEYIRKLHKIYHNTEWAALCKVLKMEDGKFVLVDMIHPPQKITAGDVTIDDDGMKWASEFLDTYDPNQKHLWNCVLHSHHNMGVFWSSTDDNARTELNDGSTMMRAVVTAYNEKEITYKGCLNFYRPFNVEIDATMVVESTPEIQFLSKENGTQAIFDNMDYSPFAEIFGEGVIPQMKTVFDNTVKEKYLEYIDATVDTDTAFRIASIDHLIHPDQLEQVQMTRQRMQNAVKQLSENIIKPKWSGFYGTTKSYEKKKSKKKEAKYTPSYYYEDSMFDADDGDGYADENWRENYVYDKARGVWTLKPTDYDNNRLLD